MNPNTSPRSNRKTQFLWNSWFAISAPLLLTVTIASAQTKTPACDPRPVATLTSDTTLNRQARSDNLASTASQPGLDHILHFIDQGNDACAIAAMRAAQFAAAKREGLPGFDARFAVRELAIAVNRQTNLSIDIRMTLVRQAAGSLQNLDRRDKIAEKAELIADSRLLLHAANQYKKERLIGRWGEMAALAITLDQQLPDAERRLAWPELLPESEYPNQQDYIGGLLSVALACRGDARMTMAMQSIAHHAYYQSYLTGTDVSRVESLTRIEKYRRLIDALDGAQPYPSERNVDSRWMAFQKIADAYHILGIFDDRDNYINIAVRNARANSSPEYRMYALRGCIFNLVYFKLDRKFIMEVASEIMSLAVQLDTVHAREIRESLPAFMQRHNLRVD